MTEQNTLSISELEQHANASVLQAKNAIYSEMEKIWKNGQRVDIYARLQLINQQACEFSKDEILETVFSDRFGFGREMGQFFTPNKVAELISVIAEIYKPKSVIDICCGTGNVLSYFKNLHIAKGVDINSEIVELAQYINPNADIVAGDTLKLFGGAGGQKSLFNEAIQYDLVVGDLPLGARTADKKALEIELIKKGLELLNNNGVAIFIVSESFLTNSVSTEFRHELISKFALEMVISLPVGILLPYTFIKTSVLVFRKGSPNQDVYMPEFNNNSDELVENFKQHKGDFYCPLEKITDRFDRNFYLSFDAIEKTLKDHQLKKLADMAEIITGKHLDKGSFLTKGKYFSFNRKYKDGNNFVDSIVDERCILRTDDIVISLIGPNNKVHLYKDDGIQTFITENYGIIRPSGKDKYISIYLQTEDGINLFKQQISRHLVGSPMPRLSLRSLSNIDIPVLPLSELNEIVSKSVDLSNKTKFYLLKSSECLNNKDYNSARAYIEQAFEHADSEANEHKEIYLQNIDRAEELEEKNKSLKDTNHRMQKLVEQFTHSLGNVIFPDTIYQVAERLKNNPECRKDVLLLHEAYHSEIIIKLQGDLLRQRHANTDPREFRYSIRSCRRTPNSAENTKSIEDIMDYAASRVTARFLNQHYAGLNSIRDKMLSKKNFSLDALKQKFEDDILLNKTLRPIAWINQYLRPVQITEISPLWQKVFMLSESHAEALLFGYFSEILFNAFKYADHDNDEFLTLVFGEKTINDKTYLTCSWLNPIKNKSPAMLGTGKGLDAIQEDLKQLNDTENPEESLLISQQNNQFQVTLFFKKDLLVNDLPSLKIKRKANVE